MSAISDYLTKQKAFNDRNAAAVDSIVKSTEGLTGDVASLNATIKQLQDSAGAVTPEDQALLDQATTQGEAVSAKLEAVTAALATLDESTPPTVPSPTV